MKGFSESTFGCQSCARDISDRTVNLPNTLAQVCLEKAEVAFHGRDRSSVRDSRAAPILIEPGIRSAFNLYMCIYKSISILLGMTQMLVNSKD